MTMRRLLVLPLLLMSLDTEARQSGQHRLPANVSLDAETAAGLSLELASPVPGARISSGFGWRRHPVLRRLRFHGGMDFAAPLGTEVLAAAAGTVQSISRARDRGLNLMICHSERVCTAYSHLSAVAPGLDEGTQVAAGSVIAEVGRSGRTTGPHLDFEVFVDGKRVDPQPLLEPQGEPAYDDYTEANFGGSAGQRRLQTFVD